MASCFLKQSYGFGVDALTEMKRVAEANGLTVKQAQEDQFCAEP